MALPANIPWPKVLTAMRDMINAGGVPARFALRGGGTVNITVAETWRSVDQLTDGISEERHRCRFMASDWDGQATRAPDKGDQVTINGKRYAVTDAYLRSAGNVKIGYVCKLSG